MRPPAHVRVLVVEDDAPLRELYRHELVAAGYLVTAVADGIDALKRIDEGLAPDVVLLDLALPTLSGLDVYRELRTYANMRSVPVIVVTGTDTRELVAADFAFVFRKPVQTDVLAKAIDALMAR